jgi:hypothetical protein
VTQKEFYSIATLSFSVQFGSAGIHVESMHRLKLPLGKLSRSPFS